MFSSNIYMFSSLCQVCNREKKQSTKSLQYEGIHLKNIRSGVIYCKDCFIERHNAMKCRKAQINVNLSDSHPNRSVRNLNNEQSFIEKLPTVKRQQFVSEVLEVFQSLDPLTAKNSEQENNIEASQTLEMSMASLELEELDIKYIVIICQECQTNSSDKYCQSCQQFLCNGCSERIHNKGKRAKHKVIQSRLQEIASKSVSCFIPRDIGKFIPLIEVDCQICQIFAHLKIEFPIEQCYFFLDEDIVFKGIEHQKFTFKFNSSSFSLEQIEGAQMKNPFLNQILIIGTQIGLHIQSQLKTLKGNSSLSDIFFIDIEDVLEDKDSFPESISQILSENFTDKILRNELSAIQASHTLTHDSILVKGNKSFTMNSTSTHAINPANLSLNLNSNISTSTDNSRKIRKLPIPFYQPFKSNKQDSIRYQTESKMRKLAQMGVLMIRRENCKDIVQQAGITRRFMRQIGDSSIEYISMAIDTISLQVLCWVLQSIREDRLAPNEKLIFSRLKESFDLKISNKLWVSVLKYLQSLQYERDIKDLQGKPLSHITVSKQVDEHYLYFTDRNWVYQDQGVLDEQEKEWVTFKQLLKDYFNTNSQINGGRYGCVQYVKLQGPPLLRQCSMGKLSLYVQKAINKGIIRYHKTLLVSNDNGNQSVLCSNEQEKGASLLKTAREIKTYLIQLGLISILMQSGPNKTISLAQIPSSLKKILHFQINLVQLGFPKLKNILQTLSGILLIQTTKAHISYEMTNCAYEHIQHLKLKLADISSYFLNEVISRLQNIIQQYGNLVLEQLYQQLNISLGFNFDYKIYEMPDFSNFINCYCNHIIDLQICSGMLIAFHKRIQYYPQQNYYYYQQNSQGNILQNQGSSHNHQEAESQNTPKFNCSLDYMDKKANINFPANWNNCLLQHLERAEEGGYGEEHEQDYDKSIMNIISDDNNEPVSSYSRAMTDKDNYKIKINELELPKITPIGLKEDAELEDDSFGLQIPKNQSFFKVQPDTGSKRIRVSSHNAHCSNNGSNSNITHGKPSRTIGA